MHTGGRGTIFRLNTRRVPIRQVIDLTMDSSDEEEEEEEEQAVIPPQVVDLTAAALGQAAGVAVVDLTADMTADTVDTTCCICQDDCMPIQAFSCSVCRHYYCYDCFQTMSNLRYSCGICRNAYPFYIHD